MNTKKILLIPCLMCLMAFSLTAGPSHSQFFAISQVRPC